MPTIIIISSAAAVFALLLLAAFFARAGRLKDDSTDYLADDEFTRSIHDFGASRRESDQNV